MERLHASDGLSFDRGPEATGRILDFGELRHSMRVRIGGD
jgi:hypothetical protein